MCPSLIQIGSKTAEKTLHKQTDRHYKNNGHMAVNQKRQRKKQDRNIVSASATQGSHNNIAQRITQNKTAHDLTPYLITAPRKANFTITAVKCNILTNVLTR